MYDAIVDYVMHKDLNENKIDEIAKSHRIAELLLLLLKKEMPKNGIEFKKSSKYFLQSMFAKMTIENAHSKMTFYFQLIGTSRKDKVELSSASFLRLIIH